MKNFLLTFLLLILGGCLSLKTHSITYDNTSWTSQLPYIKIKMYDTLEFEEKSKDSGGRTGSHSYTAAYKDWTYRGKNGEYVYIWMSEKRSSLRWTTLGKPNKNAESFDVGKYKFWTWLDISSNKYLKRRYVTTQGDRKLSIIWGIRKTAQARECSHKVNGQFSPACLEALQAISLNKQPFTLEAY